MQRMTELFGALAHPTRIRITELLLDGEQTVGEIASALSLHQSGTSQHLAVLARAGVLEVDQRGAARFYRVRGPRVGRILDLMEEFCAIHNLSGYGAVDGSEETPDPAGVSFGG